MLTIASQLKNNVLIYLVFSPSNGKTPPLTSIIIEILITPIPLQLFLGYMYICVL